MKTEADVDAIMQAIPDSWRKRWCGGKNGGCACMGCVQIGNRAVIAEKITGREYRGDPEHIDEAWLQLHGAAYTENKLSHDEWRAWKSRQPQDAGGSATMGAGVTIIYGATARQLRDDPKERSVEE